MALLCSQSSYAIFVLNKIYISLPGNGFKAVYNLALIISLN